MINEKMLEMFMKNKKVKGLLNDVRYASQLLIAFARTYLGVYDENGNRIEKGDRDYLFEALERIEKKLGEIEKKIEMLKNEA